MGLVQELFLSGQHHTQRHHHTHDTFIPLFVCSEIPTLHGRIPNRVMSRLCVNDERFTN